MRKLHGKVIMVSSNMVEFVMNASPDSANKPIIFQPGNKEALELWRTVTIHGLRDLSFDLSARQMALILFVYSRERKHTVRALASELGISKPAVSRALDRLTSYKLVQRVRDAEDRRNIYVETTDEGYSFLAQFSNIIMSSLTEIQ